MTSYIYDHLEYEWRGKKGMYAFFKDCPFPQKGFPFPQAINACNYAKRFFKRGMEALTDKSMKPLWFAFLVSSRKRIIATWLSAYGDAASMVLEPFFIEQDKMTECARELRGFLYNFLIRIEIAPEIARQFATVFSTLIQYDNAYRLRIEDLANETSKERLLKNPGKELMRLVGIMAQREPGAGNTEKFAKIVRVLRFLFISPKIKKAFRQTLQESDFANFQMDDADRYHCLLWEDYSFFGLPIKERVEMYEAWHSVFPPLPPQVNIQLAE